MIGSLGIFAKAPVPAFVKTRLTPPLTAHEAAAIYEACIRDVIAQARRIAAEVTLFFDGAHAGEAYFAREYPDVERIHQSGSDLGDRLAGGFETLFRRGAARAAVIGADAPTLPDDYLAKASLALDGADAVLGPALDGGYYLVGIDRKAWPAARILFEDIPWSTDRVLRESLARAAAADVRVGMIEEWYDIDREEDLIRARADAKTESALGRWLHDHPGW